MAATTRIGGRRSRMRQRLAMADTPEKQLTAAYDWFRSSSAYLGKRGTRYEGGRGPGYPAAARIISEAAAHLARLAEDIDEGRYDHVA